jgi:hypothetical protein
MDALLTGLFYLEAGLFAGSLLYLGAATLWSFKQRGFGR